MCWSCAGCGKVEPSPTSVLALVRNHRNKPELVAGWQVAHLGDGESGRHLAEVVCSTACLVGWAESLHEAERHPPDERGPGEVIRVTTEVHGPRLNRASCMDTDALSVACPTCAAIPGQPCELGGTISG